MRAAALLALVVLAGFAARAAAQTYDTLNSSLVDAVVVPAYQAYEAAAREVPAPIEALCADPGPARLEAAQQAWRAAMLAWQHAQTIRFGPVIDDGMAPEIAFWPDKHGTAGRQMSRALAEQDPSLLDAAALEGKSVGLTSHASLERLLFGKALLDPGQRDARGREVEVARDLPDDVGDADLPVHAVTQQVRDRLGDLFFGDGQSQGAVALRVHVNQERALATRCEGGGEVDRHRRFAAAPLLIDDRDGSHDACPFVRESGATGRSNPAWCVAVAYGGLRPTDHKRVSRASMYPLVEVIGVHRGCP